MSEYSEVPDDIPGEALQRAMPHKDSSSESVLISELLTKFLKQAKEGGSLAVSDYLTQYQGLRVKVSFGKGNVARIPWIAFLARGQEVNEGIYPVLLYFKDVDSLLLCYGVSETNLPHDAWGDVDALSVRQWFEENHGRRPDRYGSSFVMKAYQPGPEFDVGDLARKLDRLIERYKQVLTKEAVLRAPNVSANTDIAAATRAFADALRASGVSFGAGHHGLVASFLASLATKPLAILTGLSGSGKTQIAMRLGEWLGADQLKVVAVRPDWTGAEYLFGYEDGLRRTQDGRAVWSVPPALEFMLQARDAPSMPFLLLLDEMNLAHVERYFADVLSGMESRQPCLPNLEHADGDWRMPNQGPSHVSLPDNLWIVGTVNVDETTYMFSPKVLDRANTFEFRVSSEDLASDARKPGPCKGGDEGLVRGLLTIARDDEWHRMSPATFQLEFAHLMRQLHEVLMRYGYEFGHRVFYEALRFAAIAEKSGVGGLHEVLDRVIFQKVLPRLHGSRRRLELPLLALAHFCRDVGAVAPDEKLPALSPEVVAEGGTAKLSLSHDKVCRMLRALRANQFASFTE